MRILRRRILQATAVAVTVVASLLVQTSGATSATGERTAHRVTAWDRALPVPGLAKLNVGNQAGVTAVSCGAAGDCSAGGTFSDKAGHQQAFLANEVDGSWQSAYAPESIAKLATGGSAAISTIACRGAGTCVAAGFYIDADHQIEATA
jgi:hypothetical protein